MVALITVSGLNEWLDRWAPAAEWGVAVGTLALAGATGWLARRTRQEAEAATRQVTLQTNQMDAATRPLVYPACTYEFAWSTPGSPYDIHRSTLLPLKNGGPGIALNVHGACFFPNTSGGPRTSAEVHGGTIAAGDTFDARLESPVPSGWSGVEGFLRYEDIAGEEWQTHFRFGLGRTNQLVCFHDPPGKTADLGDPARRYLSRSVVVEG